MNTVETKQCKKCREQINKKAKKCPHCGAKQGMPIWLIIVIILVIIGMIYLLVRPYKESQTLKVGKTSVAASK